VRPRILLIRPDHFGDMLFVTPALRFLRKQLPDAHVTALVGPWARPVLERNPHVDVIQTLEFPGFTRKPKASPLAPYGYLWHAARTLRAQHFDAAVILRFDHWWGALLAALARIPRRIGYDVPEVKPFLTDVLRYEPGRHEVAQNLRLVASAAGVAGPEATPQAYPLETAPPDAGEGAVRELLRAHGIAPLDRFAVLVPGSGAAVKLWREEGFARVAEALHGRWQLKVVIAGAQAERELAERIRAQCATPLANLAGATSLVQLGALFKDAALAVGADSGPMHLAVAMGTPSVHLFGPVSARAFGPWGEPARHIVLTSGLACIACNRLDYTTAELHAHPCVPLIAERQVLAAIHAIIFPGDPA
jgi:heptosyltransferase-2/heptosyltransferase-3